MERFSVECEHGIWKTQTLKTSNSFDLSNLPQGWKIKKSLGTLLWEELHWPFRLMDMCCTLQIWTGTIWKAPNYELKHRSDMRKLFITIQLVYCYIVHTIVCAKSSTGSCFCSSALLIALGATLTLLTAPCKLTPSAIDCSPCMQLHCCTNASCCARNTVGKHSWYIQLRKTVEKYTHQPPPACNCTAVQLHLATGCIHVVML